MHRFLLCDVFTDRRFGGNPLAVLPDARGLCARQMQQIAREFGFSETTFVLPAEAGHTRRVRIFTPAAEIPFAGHPNLGTAWALARCGELGPLGPETRVVFEEEAGLVPIAIACRDGRPGRCELSAPAPLALGKSASPERVARALALAAADVVTARHPPMEASVGLAFLFAELRDRDALARAQPAPGELEALVAEGLPAQLYVYTRDAEGFDLRARMFAPLAGVVEDPATGSAGCALAALLAARDGPRDGELRFSIAQGIEMGRPSALHATAIKRGGEVVEARIAGDCVFVAEGVLDAES